MATPEQVRAFMQNCSQLHNVAEVERGLDAAEACWTQVGFLETLIGVEMWDGLPVHLRVQMKTDLKRKVIQDIIDRGYLPIELPEVTEDRSEVRGPWQIMKLKATAKSRPAQ